MKCEVNIHLGNYKRGTLHGTISAFPKLPTRTKLDIIKSQPFNTPLTYLGELLDINILEILNDPSLVALSPLKIVSPPPRLPLGS